MAVMISDDVEHFLTDGERQFYGFLKTAAKPDSKYLAWNLPDINGREPEFILFWDDLHPQSDVCQDASGQCFSTDLPQMIPLPLHFTMTPNELAMMGRGETVHTPYIIDKTDNEDEIIWIL